MAQRWRRAGLEAIRSITSSEGTGTEGLRQLEVVVPVLLQNIYSNNAAPMPSLQREKSSTGSEQQQAIRRRMSIATVQTVDSAGGNPAEALGSTADADMVAEQEVRILAMKCLKQVFVVSSNRGQIRKATSLLLRFVGEKIAGRQTAAEKQGTQDENLTIWASTLVETAARWTPVQDRFVILVTAMETLVRSTVAEPNLEAQLIVASMVDALLSSNVNLIGLSIMDVLLGLIQHILILLQLGGPNSKVQPHHQQTDAIDLFQDASETFDNIATLGILEKKPASTTDVMTPSPTRQKLLFRLQKCIGALGTHIYYNDQISDMITAILLRLKPSPTSRVNSATVAIEHPVAAANAIADSVNLQEDPTTDDFFSFGTARATALRAIRDILVMANKNKVKARSSVTGRNPVGVQVWEGTQWLLRDPDRDVRKAYVEALLTWLDLETTGSDLRVMEERQKTSKSKRERDEKDSDSNGIAKRAISSASQRQKPSKPSRSTFLQLLHLAIYDNAIGSPESEADILLLHLLLTNLVENLGVNAVKSGLPMIMRLQEDINVDEIVGSPTSKVHIGCLVHGYFWILSEKFDFETQRVGREIHGEIARRKQKQLWLEKIRLPPLPLEQIHYDGSLASTEIASPSSIEQETIRPCDSRAEIVEAIASSYAASVASPPSSPPASPNASSRIFSMPSFGYNFNTSPPAPTVPPEDELPVRIKEEMLSDWTKQSCILAVEAHAARTMSINGSRSGSVGRHLAINGSPAGSNPASGVVSPISQNQQNTNPDTFGLMSGAHIHRRFSVPGQEGSATPVSSSSRDSTIRVNDLRKLLAGQPRTSSPLRGSLAQPLALRRSSSNTSSESMVSGGEFSFSEAGEEALRSPTHGGVDLAANRPRSVASREGSITPKARPSTGVQSALPTDGKEGIADRDFIPPVPPIPSTLNLPGGFPADGPAEGKGAGSPAGTWTQYSGSVRTARSQQRGRAWDQGPNNTGHRGAGSRVDLGALLGGIADDEDENGEDRDGVGAEKVEQGKDGGELRSGSRIGSGIGRPPY